MESEENLIQNKSDINKEALHEINDNYIRYLKLEDSIMKQNSQLQWVKEGNTNSKFFHSLIRGRRKKLLIDKIHEKGEWFQGEENIGKSACEYFQQMFTREDKISNEENFHCIPRLVNQERIAGLSPLLHG